MVDHHVPCKNGYPYGDLLETYGIFWGIHPIWQPHRRARDFRRLRPLLPSHAGPSCNATLEVRRASRCCGWAMGKMRVKPYGNLLFREGDGTPCRTYLTQFWRMFDVFQRWFLGWIDRPTIHQLIYIITQSSKYAQSQTLRYSSRCSFWNSVQYPSSSLFSKCKSLCPSYKLVTVSLSNFINTLTTVVRCIPCCSLN